MFSNTQKLIDHNLIKQQLPLTHNLQQRKLQFDQQLKQNLSIRNKFVVCCGPCSADDPIAMEQYLLQLKAIADRCPHLLIVARVYTAKPHSNGQGYQGAAFHAVNGEQIDVNRGVERCRAMMLKCLEIGLPVADELLYPELFCYFDDLVSYWFLGARSAEDSIHRSFASGLDLCCGIKNPMDGSIVRAVDSLFAVSNPCVFPFDGNQICTSGCKTAHVVLRGGIGESGFVGNISAQDVAFAKTLLHRQSLCDFVMADLSHANSGKCAARQLDNAKLVALNENVDGAIVESYLHGGGHSTQFGVSQTDECLGVEDTALLLKVLNDGFEQRKKSKFPIL